MEQSKTIDLHDLVLTTGGDSSQMLGKFLYFSLGDMLIEKKALAGLCRDMHLPYSPSSRVSAADAFRSATGALRIRQTVTRDGMAKIYLAYCRDNRHTEKALSRELVKETLNQETNRYEKLANISYDRKTQQITCENLICDPDVDVSAACGRIKEFFELYQVCANRKQVETVCTNFLRIMEATKLDGPGHMYFVPRPHMAQVAIFEDFIGVLDQLNKTDRHLHANSFDVIDDAKQRDKMAIEFYSEVKREIALYQDRCDHFIRSGSRSPVIMDRWVMKIRALEEKKKLYEQVLQRELNDLDDEFSTLKLLGQELQIRASNLRFQRAA